MPPWLFADWSWEQLLDYWPHLCFVALTATISIAASAHAVLTKRDTRAAIAWVGLIWLTPLLGSLLYVWLGINRIRRRVAIYAAINRITHRQRRSMSAPTKNWHKSSRAVPNICANWCD